MDCQDQTVWQVPWPSTSQSLSKLGVGTLWILRAILAVELPMCCDSGNFLEAGEVTSLEMSPG